jgi:hypothetical protein
LNEIDQIVIKGSIARKLIHMGFTIKDIMPQKQSDGTIDFTRNAFLFKAQEGLDKAVQSLIHK